MSIINFTTNLFIKLIKFMKFSLEGNNLFLHLKRVFNNRRTKNDKFQYNISNKV